MNPASMEGEDPAEVDSIEEETNRPRHPTARESFCASTRGVNEEEDDSPSDAPSLGRITFFTDHPSSGAEVSTVSPKWGEDSDEGSVRHTPVQPRFGAIDREDVEIGAALHSLTSSSCSSDSSDNGNGAPVSVPSARWGDESDGNDDRNRGSGARLVTPRTPSVLMPAVDVDEHTVERRWSQDEEEPPERLRQQEGHAVTSWGSDDGDDECGSPAGFSQPFRMGAAAGVASIGARSALSPMPATHASASWGCDGEEGEDTRNGSPFSPKIPTQAGVSTQRLPPGRHDHHLGGSDDAVVAPLWMPYAQGRSGVGNEPDHSWADESEDDGYTNPRRSDGGAHVPARNATLPAFVDVDIGTDREISPRDESLAATYPGRTSTPSTTAPSPWFSALGRHFKWASPTAGRDDVEDDSGRHRWGFQPTTTPSHGDPLLGRWSRPNAAVPPRLTPLGTTESSPMHEVLTRSNITEHNSPARTPARSRRSWFRRERAKEVGPRRAAPRGQDGEKGDGGSGVRAWGWRDSLQSAPGLVGRLAVCILAVCALWLTSLSVVVDVTSGVIPCPTLTAVITAVAHAYYIVQDEREASEECVTRQSVYCDSDISNFEVSARIEVEESLASTAATFQRATSWTESCKASVREVEVSIKTWLAHGTGHSLLYSTSTDSSSSSGGDSNTSSNCSSTDRALVADFLGDTAPGRDDLASTATEFADHSIDTVVALSSYALERSEYDAAYVANATTEIPVDALALLENVTLNVPESINRSLAEISDLGETLVSCVSLRDDSATGGVGGQGCPVDGARELADQARVALDEQVEFARAGFQNYAASFEEFRLNAEESYDNWISFYVGVTELLDSNLIEITGAGPWAFLTASDFIIQTPGVPSGSGVLSGFLEALTPAEIWDSVSGAYDNFTAGVASISSQIAADIDAMGETWHSEVSNALSNISAKLIPQDYEPPLYGNSSTGGGSNTLLGSAGPGFRAAADGYHNRSLALLGGLGPAAANMSFPASPSLNSTTLVANASTVISSPVDYTFAAFTGTTASFDSWVVSLGNLALLLLLADYVFRTTSSLRLFVRFWGRGGLGMPDADVRVDKAAATAGGVVSGLRAGLVRVVIHPVTTAVFFGVVLSLVLYNLASLYVPLFEDYRAGCVERTQNGSFFSQNMYSIAYNYAADQGNREQWNYQEDHTSRRGSLCVELTANVRQYLAETDAQLRVMYEAHYDDVTAAATVGACIDTAGMGALYAEACCGYDGYTNDTCAATGTNWTLQCPLNYASGVAEAFGPLSVPLSDAACLSDTLDPAYWKVEDGVTLDCDTIPTCRMTCAGPNEELLRVVTVHAGCMVEWMLHAGTARLAATILMFLFLNISRAVLVGGMVKLNWRRLHPGVFTYQGTCTRAGELVVKNPEKKAEKSRESAGAGAKDPAAPAKESAHGGSTSPLARARSRLAARATKKAALSSRGGKGGGGSGPSRGGSDTPPDAPKKQPMTFKRIISGAVEESLGLYENGARLQILFGVLLNLPWLLVLWFGRGSNTAYVAD